MTASEKRLLKMAGSVFVIFVAFYLLPQAWQFAQAQWNTIERLEDDIERLKRLDAGTQYWTDEHQRISIKRDQINQALLQGNTRELVGAQMEGILRSIAQEHKLAILSTEVPEFHRSGEWLLVTLGMRFQGSGDSLMRFLKAIDTAKEELVVAKLELRANRNRLSGSAQITGFSRVPVTDAELANEVS